jgi:hypothetical protein
VSFRDGLLDGRRVAVAGENGTAILDRLWSLGAWAEPLSAEAALDEEAATAWVGERLPLHGLVFDARPAFGDGGRPGLSEALRLAWLATRAVATGALIPGQQPAKVTLIAPAADAGPHCEAARSGLENLARTLSVEWARFSVTAVAICPGTETPEEQIADLVCFLHCVAGEYFSGCRFDLGAAAHGPIGAGQSSPPSDALRAS